MHNFIEVANLYNDKNKKISCNCVFYIKEDSDGVEYIIGLDNAQDKLISEDLFTRSAKNVVWYVKMRKNQKSFDF